MRRWYPLMATLGLIACVVASCALFAIKSFEPKSLPPEPPIPIYPGAANFHDTGYYPWEVERPCADMKDLIFTTPDSPEQVRAWYDQHLAGIWYADFHGLDILEVMLDDEYGSQPRSPDIAPYTLGLTLTPDRGGTMVKLTLRRNCY
jgi:hypothetical protein